jgi:adenosylcobinamide-GDP ribazoletransferase
MVADLRAAVGFLTTLPVRYPEGRKAGYAFAYFPLVGLLIGGLLCLLALLPWPAPGLRAFAVLVLWVMITGGLHLDGFGDACDGLLATTTPARRLEIMKDPHAGSWAVIGLVLLLLGKWLLIAQVQPLWLMLPPVMGRWAMTLAAYHFSYARTTGLGAFFREGFGRSQWIAAGLTTLVVLLIAAGALHVRLLALALLPPLTVALVGRWAAARLGGGLTGDVYGALCELTELFSLAWLSSL